MNFTDAQKATVLLLLKNALYDKCDQHFRLGHECKETIDHLEKTIQVLEPNFSMVDWALQGAPVYDRSVDPDKAFDDYSGS